MQEVELEKRRNASITSSLPDSQCGSLIEKKEVFESIRTST